MTKFELTPVADVGVMLRFGNSISEKTEALVQAADKAVSQSKISGVTETIPSYTALFVGYDPLKTDPQTLLLALQELDIEEPIQDTQTKVWDVPVCYEDPHGSDLDHLAQILGKSRAAIVGEHLAGDYRVSMYGFAPGYAYMRGVPQDIQLPRKPKPVKDVAKGSVIMAGPQCLVTTLTMPSGWWTLGYSPFDFLKPNDVNPFPVAVGSRIRFRRISSDELFKIRSGAYP